MADLIVAPTLVPILGEGPLRVALRVTKINSKLAERRIVLELGGVEISIPLAEVDPLLASLIEERNKGLAL